MTDPSGPGARAFDLLDQAGPPPAGPRGGGPTRIIDSFRVSDGISMRLDLHLWRTWRAVEAAFGRGDDVPGWAQLDAMLTQGVAHTPREGEWFPLFEVSWNAHAGVRCSMQAARPAPAARRTTTLAVVRDRRRFPTFKGADAEITAADRGAANDAGDDDAVYLDEAGRVLEAANGAVIGWRGNTLCIPDAPGRMLPSTTVAAMVAHLDGWRPPDPQLPRSLAAERIADSAVARRCLFRPDEVDELWYVNALHGFTPVVCFDGDARAFEPTRLSAWIETSHNWWEPTS